MAGAHRIPDQGDIVRGPLLGPQQRKVAPDRTIRHKRVAAEVGSKYAFTVNPALFIAHPVETAAVPRDRVAFHDERAHVGRVAVVVCYEVAVLVMTERESEALERFRRSVP